MKGSGAIFRIVLLAIGLFVLWQFSGVVLLVFAASLVGVIVHALARNTCRVLPLSYGWSLAVSLIVLVLLIGAGIYLLGLRIQTDFAYLWQELPRYLENELTNLGIDLGSLDMQQQLGGAGAWTGLLGGLANYTTGALNIVTTTILVVVGGIFLAARPVTYRDLVVHLFPRSQADRVRSVLGNLRHALEHWLIGQFILMVVVGVATTLGLMLIGVPSALGLGLLAGILEFIPVVGPIVAAVPALLVALSTGFTEAALTGAVYLGIQQIESNVLVPQVQRRTVSLPPAVGLLAILVFGLWFGPLGVVLSAPLAVCAHLLLVQLYMRDTLGWDVEIPGAMPQKDKS